MVQELVFLCQNLLIEKNMQGILKASNKDDGAFFEIKHSKKLNEFLFFFFLVVNL